MLKPDAVFRGGTDSVALSAKRQPRRRNWFVPLKHTRNISWFLAQGKHEKSCIFLLLLYRASMRNHVFPPPHHCTLNRDFLSLAPRLVQFLQPPSVVRNFQFQHTRWTWNVLDRNSILHTIVSLEHRPSGSSRYSSSTRGGVGPAYETPSTRISHLRVKKEYSSVRV